MISTTFVIFELQRLLSHQQKSKRKFLCTQSFQLNDQLSFLRPDCSYDGMIKFAHVKQMQFFFNNVYDVVTNKFGL